MAFFVIVIDNWIVGDRNIGRWSRAIGIQVVEEGMEKEKEEGTHSTAAHTIANYYQEGRGQERRKLWVSIIMLWHIFTLIVGKL